MTLPSFSNKQINRCKLPVVWVNIAGAATALGWVWMALALKASHSRGFVAFTEAPTDCGWAAVSGAWLPPAFWAAKLNDGFAAPGAPEAAVATGANEKLGADDVGWIVPPNTEAGWPNKDLIAVCWPEVTPPPLLAAAAGVMGEGAVGAEDRRLTRMEPEDWMEAAWREGAGAWAACAPVMIIIKNQQHFTTLLLPWVINTFLMYWMMYVWSSKHYICWTKKQFPGR